MKVRVGGGDDSYMLGRREKKEERRVAGVFKHRMLVCATLKRAPFASG